VQGSKYEVDHSPETSTDVKTARCFVCTHSDVLLHNAYTNLPVGFSSFGSSRVKCAGHRRSSKNIVKYGKISIITA
jgi:hypothetical protein